MQARFQQRGPSSPPARHEVLPVLEPSSAAGKRLMKRLSEAEKRIHFVPVLLLLSFFILWWFCYPVTLEMAKGRVVAIHRFDLSYLNDTAAE